MRAYILTRVIDDFTKYEQKNDGKLKIMDGKALISTLQSKIDDSRAHLARYIILSRLTCGAVAGCVAKTVIAPAERVKMSFQISSERFSLRAALLKGKRMVKDEGVRSLWNGHSTTIMRVAPYAGLQFAVHDHCESFFREFLMLDSEFDKPDSSASGWSHMLAAVQAAQQAVHTPAGSAAGLPAAVAAAQAARAEQEAAEAAAAAATTASSSSSSHSPSSWPDGYKPHSPLPASYKFAAGAISGVVATLLTYPLDVLRVRLALTPGATYLSALRHGSGLYQGLLPTLVGIVPYSGTAWCAKQTLAEHYRQLVRRRETIQELVVINAIAGLSGQFVTYPLDVLRRRMQMSNDCHKRGVIETLKRLTIIEGPRGLLKGFTMNIIKGPITISISMSTYDALMRWIKG
jgi:solute carrier family 25 protein 42